MRDFRLLPRFALLLCFASLFGCWLQTFRDMSVPSSSAFSDCFTLEDVTDNLSRNVGNQLPTNAAKHNRRAKTSSTYMLSPHLFHGHTSPTTQQKPWTEFHEFPSSLLSQIYLSSKLQLHTAVTFTNCFETLIEL
jgi:hypothetical protein